ncbi:MAG: type VI secretion system tip protein VgrG [Proteobacteria bacterium]|nr:type VI secretion system tip protein VgrG [Pseudomonadota bacterium]MBU0968499.1 type VI secretion system tip protein VgrG [Pseudomonadota bacterium]
MLTQENRLLAIDTPLGPDVLLLTRFRGNEGLSTLFSFELELTSENHNISFNDIIGKAVTVSLFLADGSRRYFHGLICRFRQGRAGGETESEMHLAAYTATMVPWFWFLTRTADCRIFQKLTVPEIVERIFSDHGFSDYILRLHGKYEPREYAVQYRETDFNFVSRLLEEEGIFYFFEHEEKKHTLVLADLPVEHKSCPNQEIARYQISTGGQLEEDVVTALEIIKEIRPGKFSLNDYNYETPKSNLQLSVSAKEQLGPTELEIYDYPGEYGKYEEGSRLVNIRMEEEEARITTISGSGECRSFVSGCRFKLQDYFRADLNEKEYVLTRISHNANQAGGYRSAVVAGEGGESSYVNRFECMPYEIPFRPVRSTRKPIVEGVQTAIVVGPEGEEIHTDQYGRVKVQFHWDREGENNENSSCWIRVSQAMSGNRWGAVFLPRIGHEVTVDFIEGDPDRPIIIGQVYHGNNNPPYALPDNKTMSTFKSNSSPKGDGFNEIRFEDKKGEEQLFLHAEKNMDIRVKNDRLETIGHDRHLVVENDRKEHIKNDRHEKVDNHHQEEIGGDRHLRVIGKQATEISKNMSLTVTGDVAEVFKANHSEQATKDYFLKAANVVIEAGTNITVKVGGSYLVIESGGITLSSSGDVEIKGMNVTLEAKANLEAKGSAMVSIQGGIVKIN